MNDKDSVIGKNDLDKTNFLAISILVSAIIVSGSLIYVFGPNKGGDIPTVDNMENSGSDYPSPVDGVMIASLIDNDPTKGDANAPVTIVEFSDFECPFCGRFRDNTLPLIIKNYIDTGKVKLVYRDFPLGNIHPQAMLAAQAAECANEQGRFWEYHNVIFDNQDSLSTDIYKVWASRVGLNMSQFNSCTLSQKYSDEVSRDIKDGQQAGVSGTPTFFIGPSDGKAIMLVGAQPYAVFSAAIDKALAQ